MATTQVWASTLTLVLATASPGCVSALQGAFATSFKSYAGAYRPRAEIGVVAQEEHESGAIIAIDRQAVPDLVAEMLPGQHLVAVSFNSGSERSVRPESLALTVEAGHTYEVYAFSYPYIDRWHPAARDITSELGCPEYASRASLIEKALARARDSDTPFAAHPPCPGVLSGFGEQHTAQVQGKGGKSVALKYAFDRHHLVIAVDGDDGATYDVVLAEGSGEVTRVLGTNVYIGTLHKLFCFQPLGCPGKLGLRRGRSVREDRNHPDQDGRATPRCHAAAFEPAAAGGTTGRRNHQCGRPGRTARRCLRSARPDDA